MTGVIKAELLELRGNDNFCTISFMLAVLEGKNWVADHFHLFIQPYCK